MPNTAPQRHSKTVSEGRNAFADFKLLLTPPELLTGVPVVTEIGTSDLIISNVAINSAVIVVNNSPCNPGQAVVLSLAGGVVGMFYTIQIKVVTDAAAPQTFVATIKLGVAGD